MESLAVNEIFFSIQGESTHVGRPCIFIRLAGCPLRCHWCDTEYAFDEGHRMEFSKILEEVKKFPSQLVEITGGEPLAQPLAPLFMQFLIDQGYELLLETSGAFCLKSVPKEVKIIMDLKAPDSGESSRNLFENLVLLNPSKDEVKFVISSRRDFDWALDVTKRFELFEKTRAVLVSPVHSTEKFQGLEPEHLAAWILKSGLPFRMQLQLHKYIWSPDRRGV